MPNASDESVNVEAFHPSALAAARSFSGMSRSALASAAGVSVQSISAWEAMADGESEGTQLVRLDGSPGRKAQGTVSAETAAKVMKTLLSAIEDRGGEAIIESAALVGVRVKPRQD